MTLTAHTVDTDVYPCSPATPCHGQYCPLCRPNEWIKLNSKPASVDVTATPECPHGAPLNDYGYGTMCARCQAEGWSVTQPDQPEEDEKLAYAVQRKLRDMKALAEAKRLYAAEDVTIPTEGSCRYADTAALLDDGIPEPPSPDYLHRADGVALFYAGKVNALFGDPECGKTWIALAAIAAVLDVGKKAAFLDLDHNGHGEVIQRLLLLGAPKEALRDPDRFRYCEPDDAESLLWFAADIATWAPNLAVVDSIGELMPMLGLSSNSPDDYSRGHRQVLTKIAKAGAAVVAIDHLPKDDDAREKGQTGTGAKKRAVNGVTLRVTVNEQFTPGHGGSANMTINKDRPGGLRKHSPQGKKAPAGRFVMTEQAGVVNWWVTKPEAFPTLAEKTTDGDLAELDGLVPPPRSKKDVQDRLKWGSDRAQRALKTWRDLRECTTTDG